LIASACQGRAEEFRFVPVVIFKLASPLGGLAGSVGTLSTKIGEKDIRMRLTNVAAAGADGSQELDTVVDKSDLSLIRSDIADVVKGDIVRRMERKSAPSIIDGKPTTVFVYKERKDGKETVTEPFVEFMVADFLSVMVVAADAIHQQKKGPVKLSMLRDRSVSSVVMEIEGPETVGGRDGTKVLVHARENRAGITYVIARTNDGAYYPARITVDIPNKGPATLDGSPQ
jgi:hypothetical protein